MLYTSNLYSAVCQPYLNKTEKKKNDGVEKATTLQGCPAMKQNWAYEGAGGECSVKSVTCHSFPLGRHRDHFISGTAEVWRGPVTYLRSPSQFTAETATLIQTSASCLHLCTLTFSWTWV